MALDDGSTQQGDRNLSESDVAEILTERRAAAAEAPPEGKEQDVNPEQLRAEALGEDEVPETEAVEDDPPGEENQEDDDPNPDADDDDGDQGTDSRFESVDELAEAVGQDLDEFLDSVKVSTIVDGETGSVTLAQLVKGHQLESSFTRKNQEWIEQKKAAEDAMESERAKVRDHFQMATTAFELAQEELMAEYNAIDWDSLAKTDQSQWTMKRQQLGERQARLNQKREASQASVAQALQLQEQQEAEAREARLEEGHKILLEKIPEWQDEKVRTAEATEISKYLLSAGYGQDEISSLEDHRLVLLARAALGLQGPSKKKLDLAQKKVDSVPRLAKKGGQAQKGSGVDKAVTEAKARLKKSGDSDDAANVLIARAAQRKAKAKRNARRRAG